VVASGAGGKPLTTRKWLRAGNNSIFILVAALPVLLFIISCSSRPDPSDLFVAVTHNRDPVPRYSIFELSFKHNGVYQNKFFDVSVETVFTSPNGTQYHLKGFFYADDLWKVRIRPDEPGRWTYTYLVTGKGGFSKKDTGTFECTPSGADGPVVRNPRNPFRWMFANGKPYFLVGLQDCVPMRGGKLLDAQVDGGTRQEGGKKISWDEYFSLYSGVGFNLFRFSQRNCSYPLFDDLDHYRETEGLATDELLSSAREHGFRVMFGFFGNYYHESSANRYRSYLMPELRQTLGWQKAASWAPEDEQALAEEQRFIEYCIARWGVYVDFWELLNERRASDQWTTHMAAFVHSADPDHRPVSTSWQKPYLPTIDINAPHWYESESERDSDLRVEQQAAKWKQFGKPVLVGEQGNSGMNWVPLSATRMRIRTWTALFEEIGLIFWNTSWSKAGMHGGRYTPGSTSNIYLGPEERGYVRVVQDFSSCLDDGVRMARVKVSAAAPVRAYGLISDAVVAAYLHHAGNPAEAILGGKITLPLPAHTKLTGEWIEPASGRILAPVKIAGNHDALQVPAFNVDLALLAWPAANRRQPLRRDTGCVYAH
jgi:Domain of unknown function (DUF5060)